MGEALGREGVAGHGVHEAQVQIAGNAALPAGMSEIVERSGDFQRSILDAAATGGDAQSAQRGGVAGQVKRSRKVPLNRLIRRLFDAVIPA